MTTVGERIRRLRTEKNLTQEDLGKILGVTKSAVQKYENGTIVNFKSDVIQKMSEYFGVAPAYFIFEEFPEYSSSKISGLLVAHYGSWFEDFLVNINKLNTDGKQKLYAYCEDLALIDKYKQDKYKGRLE